MPVHGKRLTDTVAKAIPLPTEGYAIHWCPGTPGFGVRVTSAGARAWVLERRIDGKTVRRTVGKVQGRNAISAAAAREVQIDISSDLQKGKDPLAVKRARRRAAKIESITFEQALKAYVKNKRRGKDGLPLKARTQDDYLAMLEAPGKKKNGTARQSGELYALAERPLHRITASDITKLFASLADRGERRQTYAMQVLRAVLRHEGVVIQDNPLATTTAGKGRVTLAPSRGSPTPIPAERLGAWWRASSAIKSASSAQLRFQLLTGCRPGEAAGITVADVDLVGGRVTLRDTKNRSDHVLVLSTQALEIVKPYVKAKKPNALVFGVADAGKTLASINAEAEVGGISPHKLRHTFATIAAQLVPAFTLRRLLNQAAGSDVAAAHYVGVSEAQLRDGWQKVADFITAAN